MKAESVRKPVALRLPRLLWRLVRVGFRQETEFRVDFWLTIIQFLVYNALFVTFWRAITSGTMALGPWTTGELIVFSFMGSLQATLGIPFLGFRSLPETVREGGLDKYLCRPVHPVLLLCFESIHVVFFLRGLLVDLLALTVCILYFHLQVTILGILLAGVFTFIGTLVWACVNGTVALLSFWMGKVETINFLVQSGRQWQTYPINIFAEPLRALLTWVLPVSLIATYPTQALLDKLGDPVAGLATALLLLLGWGVLFAFISKKAVAENTRHSEDRV